MSVLKKVRLRILIGFCWFCFFSGMCSASVTPHAVAIDIGSSVWQTGGSQLLNTTWKAGNVLKTFRSSFSPASLAYVLASVAASWAVEEFGNQGIDAIKAWMATAGLAYGPGGTLTKQSAGGVEFIPGSSEATDWNALMTAHPTWVNGGISGDADAGFMTLMLTSACAFPNGHSYANGSTVYIYYHAGYCGSGPVTVFTQSLNGGGVAHQQTVPGAPVAATPADVVTAANNDLALGTAACHAAVVQAEGVIAQAITAAPWVDISQNPPIAVPTAGVIDRAVPGFGSDVNTPRKAIETPAAIAIGQPLIDMGAAADPVPGEITPPLPVPDTKPYSDPAYSGTYTKAAWDNVEGFGTRLHTFTEAVRTTGLFMIPGGLFQGLPGGGSSTFTINGGTNYGVHTVDMSTWGSLLTILRACFLLGFAYGSVKIVMLKGG